MKRFCGEKYVECIAALHVRDSLGRVQCNLLIAHAVSDHYSLPITLRRDTTYPNEFPRRLTTLNMRERRGLAHVITLE
jgi:hypothetical protein